MNQCLVTKLKSAVNDVTLPHLGEIRILKREDLTTSDQCYLQFTSNKSVIVSIINDGAFYTDNTLTNTLPDKSLTFNGSRGYYFTPGSEISIYQKYYLTEIRFSASIIDLNQFDYMNSLCRFYLTSNCKSTGTIDVFKNCPLIGFGCTDQKEVTGNLDNFSNLYALEEISITKCKYITGDITKAFGKSVNFTYMNIADASMSGSIESLVAAQIAAGRTTGTIKVPWLNAFYYITYQDIALSNHSGVPQATNSSYFSWDADGNITFGVTES